MTCCVCRYRNLDGMCRLTRYFVVPDDSACDRFIERKKKEERRRK